MPTTNFTWDPVADNLLTEDDGGQATIYTTCGKEFGETISERSDTSKIFHVNGVSSVTELTNSNSDVIDAFTYSAFGAVVIQSGSNTVEFGWIGSLGYYFDSEVGSYHVRRRSYSQSESRWLSPDPLGVTDGPNRYSYAGNSPNSRVDPSGLFAVNPEIQFGDYATELLSVGLMEDARLSYFFQWKMTIPMAKWPKRTGVDSVRIQSWQHNETTASKIGTNCHGEEKLDTHYKSDVHELFRERKNGKHVKTDTQALGRVRPFDVDWCVFRSQTTVTIGFNPKGQSMRERSNVPMDKGAADKMLRNMVGPKMTFKSSYVFIDPEKCKCGCVIPTTKPWEQLTTPWGVFENNYGKYKR